MEHRYFTNSFSPNYSMNLTTSYPEKRHCYSCEQCSDAHGHGTSFAHGSAVPFNQIGDIAHTETMTIMTTTNRMPMDLRARPLLAEPLHSGQLHQNPQGEPAGSQESPDEYKFAHAFKRVTKRSDLHKGEPCTYQTVQMEGITTRVEYEPEKDWERHYQENQRENIAANATHHIPPATDRTLEHEKEMRRLRNNEASRRSRREKKQRFMETERRVEEMRLSNRRLSDYLVELESVVVEMKAILVAYHLPDGQNNSGRRPEEFEIGVGSVIAPN